MKQNQCKFCTNGIIRTPVDAGHFNHVKKVKVDGEVKNQYTNLGRGQEAKCPYCKPDKIYKK